MSATETWRKQQTPSGNWVLEAYNEETNGWFQIAMFVSPKRIDAIITDHKAAQQRDVAVEALKRISRGECFDDSAEAYKALARIAELGQEGTK